MTGAKVSRKKPRIINQIVFVILISTTIFAVIYPFLPEFEYYVDNESTIFAVQSKEIANYPVILSTPNYSLVGTKEEKEAGLVNGVAGLDILKDAQLLEKPIVDPSHKQLVIPKIGVDMSVIVTGKEYDEADAYAALNKGAWLYTTTSTPNEGGNTVIAGHRFKYLPPSSNTLYSLDKLEKGDDILVYWQGREYTYRVVNEKVIHPTDLSILNTTPSPTLTLITCTPVFSNTNRLVVTASLVGVK